MVGDHPVVLLGHQAVETAQTRLDVAEEHLAGVGSDRPGGDGVGVALVTMTASGS